MLLLHGALERMPVPCFPESPGGGRGAPGKMILPLNCLYRNFISQMSRLLFENLAFQTLYFPSSTYEISVFCLIRTI